MSIDRSSRPRMCPVIAALLISLTLTAPVLAWQNVLQDPGFERYHYDANLGYYVPDANAAWQEYGFGQASVRYDFSGWTAPAEMSAERPLGFTPGAGGFEGYGVTQNKGVLGWQQDFVNSSVMVNGQFYEAWIWLGGAGNDDQTDLERKEEFGGWHIFFYMDPNPANWTDENAIEIHHETFDYWGEPQGFRRVSGLGRVPGGAVGFRFRVVANTWATASGGANYNTRVAVDNAHFAMVTTPNLLANGDFEADTYLNEFKNWQRPAVYPFPLNGIVPVDIGDWDTPDDRPFIGGTWTYGYSTYLNGWLDDAFNFSQTVNYTAPAGTPVDLMCDWVQDCKGSNWYWQLRYNTSEIQYVVQYLDSSDQLINVDDILLSWPIASNPANFNTRDQNADKPFNTRVRLVPPTGTAKIRLNADVKVHCPYRGDQGWELMAIAVDNFYLNYIDQQISMFNNKVDSITYRSARVRWLTDTYVGSHVDYGTTTAYGQEYNDPTPVISRAITLTDLKPGRKYYYRAKSGLAQYPQAGQESTVYFTLPALGDFDGDGDVDMEDFGRFQACLSGTDVPQTNAECTWMKLDTDTDVDADDMDVMLGCMSGPGIALDPDCGEE